MANVKFKPTSANYDLAPDGLALDQVTAVRNVVPNDNLLAQAPGYRRIGPDPLQFAPRYLLPTQTDSEAFWIAGGNEGVLVTDLDAIDQDITPPGFLPVGDITQPYTGGIIEQNPVLNVRNSGPYWWDRDLPSPMQPLPGWPDGDLADSVRPFREFLVAMNILAGVTRVPDLVRVSDAAPPGQVPQEWTPAIDNLAVERSVAFNPGGLVDGLQLIDRFYMYKGSSVYLLQYTAGAFVFSVRPVFSTFGALARNCIVEWRGQHIVLADGDLIIHDGINARSLVDERIRREIFDNLDGASQENSYLYLNAAQEVVVVCRPKIGEIYPSEGFVVSLSDNSIGKIDLQPQTPHIGYGIVAQNAGQLETTWDAKTTTWATDPTRWNQAAFLRTADQPLLADSGDRVLIETYNGPLQDGNPLQTHLERVGIALDASDRRKYARRLWPTFEAALGAVFTIEIGSHDHLDTAPVYGPPQTFVVGTDRFVNFDVQGYYLAYRITSSEQLQWRLTNMELELEVMGRY